MIRKEPQNFRQTGQTDQLALQTANCRCGHLNSLTLLQLFHCLTTVMLKEERVRYLELSHCSKNACTKPMWSMMTNRSTDDNVDAKFSEQSATGDKN